MSRVAALGLSRLRALSAPDARGIVRKGAWGLADHALMSATNFVTMVLMARVLSPQEFGAYALAYTGLLFINSLQSALLTQPQTMLGATRHGSDFVRYTTDTAWTQVFFATLAALVACVLGLVAAGAGWGVASLLFAFAPATVAWQFQEFIRTILYTQSAVAQVFRNDLISYGGQIVLVVLLWRMEALTPVSAVGALALTSLLGVVLGLWQVRSYLDWHISWSRIRETAAGNWAFGRWLLGGNLAWWTSGQIYPIFAASLISVTATGAMRAVQTIVGPTHIVMMAMDPLFGPPAAREYAAGGIPCLRRYTGRVRLFVMTLLGGYCLIVAVFARQILELVYGPEYSRYAWLLVVIAIVYAASGLRAPLNIALKAMGETRAIFRAHVAATVANLTVGLAAVSFFGLPGAGAGWLLNAAILQVVVWHFYLRHTGGLRLPRALGRITGRGHGNASLEST